MRIALERHAISDIGLAVKFYNFQAPGLGTQFESSVFDDISTLSTLHGFHPKRLGIHRLLAAHFPFGIFYQVLGDHIRVIAVLDLRADPDKISRTLRRRG